MFLHIVLLFVVANFIADILKALFVRAFKGVKDGVKSVAKRIAD